MHGCRYTYHTLSKPARTGRAPMQQCWRWWSGAGGARTRGTGLRDQWQEGAGGTWQGRQLQRESIPCVSSDVLYCVCRRHELAVGACSCSCQPWSCQSLISNCIASQRGAPGFQTEAPPFVRVCICLLRRLCRQGHHTTRQLNRIACNWAVPATAQIKPDTSHTPTRRTRTLLLRITHTYATRWGHSHARAAGVLCIALQTDCRCAAAPACAHTAAACAHSATSAAACRQLAAGAH